VTVVAGSLGGGLRTSNASLPLPPSTAAPASTTTTTSPATTSPTSMSPGTTRSSTSAPSVAAVAQVLAAPLANGRAAVTWQLATLDVSYVVRTHEGSQVVGQQTADGLSTVVSGLVAGHSYSFEVASADGRTTLGVSNTVSALAAVVPGPLTALTATADRSINRATVQWQPPTTGPSPETYDIGVFENGRQVGAFTCDAPCTQRSVDLTPGTTAEFHVDAANLVGRSPVVISNSVTIAKPCPVACLDVDATSPGAQATRRADGFLHAIGSKTDPALVDALHPTRWRVSLAWNQPNEAGYAAAHANELTEILSDDWMLATNTGQGAAIPWSDWSRYSNFITLAVRTIESWGIPIKYWEIQNEPGAPGYYPSGVAPTVDQLLTQFRVAYQAVKAADPRAKVVAPSLIGWGDTPSGGALDMRTFLDFAVANGLRFDALSFHDNSYYRRPDEYAPDWWGMQPDEVGRSVDQLRGLLAERPSLGHPAILVNEYADPYTYALPGWDVGRIGALEAARVDGAQRTCWWAGCVDGYLDGLLTGDGHAQRPNYWVYAFYGSMSGRIAPVTTTYTSVTGFATVDAGSTTRILVGRHEGCAPQLQSSICPNQPSLRPADLAVDVRVAFGGGANVTIASMPAAAGTLVGPASQSSTAVPVVNGRVSVTLPAVNDGDAWEITITSR
jgi:hypothetical protein